MLLALGSRANESGFLQYFVISFKVSRLQGIILLLSQAANLRKVAGEFSRQFDGVGNRLPQVERRMQEAIDFT